MFPLSDNNPTLRWPVVTYGLIAANLAVWILIQGMGAEPALSSSVCRLGLIPGEFLQRLPDGFVIGMGNGLGCVITEGRAWWAPLTSMFSHGSWMHVLGNMWFLHVFGNNVEDVMGRGRFLAFFLLAGLGAAAAQVVVDPASPVPMVGASGAIGGVMGAYVMLYPRAQIRTFVFLFFIEVPAFVMLGYWFLLQVLGNMTPSPGGGVAFAAHIGGFLAGVALTPLFRNSELVAQHRLASGFRWR